MTTIYVGELRRAAKIPSGEWVLLWGDYQAVVSIPDEFIPKDGDAIEFVVDDVSSETPAGGYIPDPSRPSANGPMSGPRTPGGYRRAEFTYLKVRDRVLINARALGVAGVSSDAGD